MSELRCRLEEFLGRHNPEALERVQFLRRRFAAGLAWVHFPRGLGGLGISRSLQTVVDEAFEKAGAPSNDPARLGIGPGMAAPTILAFGTEEQKQRFLRPLWTGEEIWCQLFSEPNAGSDLAAVATRAAREGDEWRIDGQKVWTSGAHNARWGILLARSDPNAPKHAGLTYFVCDMRAEGVEVRPLRQITGEAEFNEVFLNGVRIPDFNRLGPIGDGWKVAQATLRNERLAIGGGEWHREGGMIGAVARSWRECSHPRTPDMLDRLMSLWVEAELLRLSGQRINQLLEQSQPGAEASGLKIVFARVAQQLSGLELEFAGESALRYDDWTLMRPDIVDFQARNAGYRYLRAKGNSIEGGTSEILRNIISERVLDLPVEAKADKHIPWRDLPR